MELGGAMKSNASFEGLYERWMTNPLSPEYWSTQAMHVGVPSSHSAREIVVPLSIWSGPVQPDAVSGLAEHSPIQRSPPT